MDVVVETNVLGWLDCIALVGAALGTVIAWRKAPRYKDGWRQFPPGWFGVALVIDVVVAGLSFVHGSMPMVARLAQSADRTGLYVASAALLLAFAQVVVAWLAPALQRSRWFTRFSIGNVVVISVMGLGHIVLNGG
jgi:hypothetical protein